MSVLTALLRYLASKHTLHRPLHFGSMQHLRPSRWAQSLVESHQDQPFHQAPFYIILDVNGALPWRMYHRRHIRIVDNVILPFKFTNTIKTIEILLCHGLQGTLLLLEFISQCNSNSWSLSLREVGRPQIAGPSTSSFMIRIQETSGIMN